jgi:PAS domain S-box-containing protein
MPDTDLPKDQLIAELTALRQRVVELETVQAAHAQTADALQASERRYRQLMEHSLGLVCIHDLDGILLEVNTAAARALGYHPRDGVGKSLRAFIAPAVQHQFDAYLERIRHQSSDSGLLRVVTRTGEERVWLYRNIRYEEPDHPPYVLGHALDITERVQMEQALKQAHETLERRVAARTAALQQVNAQLQVEITERKRAEGQLRFQAQLLDSVQESVVATDLEGRVTYWGKGAEALYGYRAEEVLGRPITCIVGSPDEKEEEQQRLRTVYETGAWQGQYVQQRKDGSPFWADTVIALVTDAHDQPCGFVGIDRDITARQQAEAERQRLETQLHQMQKMEALGTLAGGIAHEFNNILMAILGYTQLATSQVPPASAVSQYLQEVHTAGQRAKELVQQILTFSRPHDHSREPIELSGVIQDALKFLRASLPTTIEMRQHIALETGTVLANANQMHQVLMNLCANAAYAMRETGGILKIGVDAVEIDATVEASPPALHSGSYVRMRVRDTGAGIPVDVVDRVFEPFFTTKGIGEGTGMGLAIVHGIVTSHGGAITVQSTLGEGTTFTLYLPQMAQDPAPPSAPPAPIVPPGKGRLLLVDDEEMLARLGQALLERLGYEVVAHSSSLAALEAFQAEPSRFDLIITDQTMPVMTGATLVAELRHIRPDIPIILCTGFSHLMNAEKAEALGVDAFVLKPGVTQELAATIQQVLENRARQGR